MPSNIKSLKASRRLDASGTPALQTTLTTTNGIYTSLIPFPPLATPDHIHHGIYNTSDIIAPPLLGTRFDVRHDLSRIDSFVADSSSEKKVVTLGREERLGVSIAVARAGADGLNIPLYEHLRLISNTSKPYILPVPFFPILSTSELEFSIAPLGATTFSAAVKMGTETYQCLQAALDEKSGHLATNTTPTGTFSIPSLSPQEALHLLVHTIHTAGHTGNISISLTTLSPSKLTTAQKASLFQDLLSKFPLTLFETPIPREDAKCASWAAFMSEVRAKGEVAVVETGVLATHEGITEVRRLGSCNGVSLQLGDFGNVSEVIQTIKHTIQSNLTVLLTSPAPQTPDTFLADLCVGLGTGSIKAGAPARGENVARLNRLLDIEEELRGKGEDVAYAGREYKSACLRGREGEGKHPFNVYGH